MSWGTELWDQFENITAHSQKGIEFCEKYAHFIKERCSIENEYANKLRKLVKNYQPKKKEEEDYEFTCSKGFLCMVNEVHDMAGQHEVITENLNTTVGKELIALVNEIKQERKRSLQEGQRQRNVLQNQIQQLDRVKGKYDKAFKEMEKSQEAFKKADADIHLSRAEVEKAKNLMMSKQQYSESCKKDYAAELQKTNNCQTDHFHTNMPQIFQQLQAMEEKRIEKIQGCIRKSAEIERSVLPIINTCIDGFCKAADSISATQDIKIVVNKYKSGYPPPGDIPFEDLSNGNMPAQVNNSTPRPTRTDSIKGNTMSGGKARRRGLLQGLFTSKTDETKEDYSHLPPNQQKKKLSQKIDAIQKAIATETAERDGMIKMRDVYAKNTALGDPASLDKQLEENAQKLDRHRQELQKFEAFYNGADSASLNVPSAPTQISSNPATPVAQHVKTKDMLNMANTRKSVGYLPACGNVPRTTVLTSASSDPAINTMAHDESFSDDGDFPDGEFRDELGTARALYNFEAPNDGSIPMVEGEDFSIVEADQGDGWTRVRKQTGEEGFVPSSYVTCTYYQ